MDPKPQPAREDRLTVEVFGGNLRRELKRSPLKEKSFKTLAEGFPEEELILHLFNVARACRRVLPRTTQDARLRTHGLTRKSFKTMLERVQRFVRFMER
jgi:hypothetical protein